MIDWKSAQQRLGVPADGVPGSITWGALIALVGQPCVPAAKALAAWSGSYNLNTPARIADFLAQCGNETGGWRRWEEDIRYSADAMLRSWPTHFTAEQARAAVGNPVEIASRAYGGRNGNAAYPSKDGYTYRGRGALQLTGKANYAAYGKAIGLDLVANPDLASNPYDSILIALEFYRQGKVFDAIDAGDTARARRITNGGSNGLDNVNRLRTIVLKVFA
jgi:putative chitinase